MTAPTAAEVREAITRTLHTKTLEGDDFGGLYEDFRPILDSDVALTRNRWVESFHATDEHPGTLWADMTTEEAEELSGAMYRVLDRVLHDATILLAEGCIEAAVAFADAHPNIPRGSWQPAEAVPA